MIWPSYTAWIPPRSAIQTTLGPAAARRGARGVPAISQPRTLPGPCLRAMVRAGPPTLGGNTAPTPTGRRPSLARRTVTPMPLPSFPGPWGRWDRPDHHRRDNLQSQDHPLLLLVQGTLPWIGTITPTLPPWRRLQRTKSQPSRRARAFRQMGDALRHKLHRGLPRDKATKVPMRRSKSPNTLGLRGVLSTVQPSPASNRCRLGHRLPRRRPDRTAIPSSGGRHIGIPRRLPC